MLKQQLGIAYSLAFPVNVHLANPNIHSEAKYTTENKTSRNFIAKLLHFSILPKDFLLLETATPNGFPRKEWIDENRLIFQVIRNTFWTAFEYSFLFFFHFHIAIFFFSCLKITSGKNLSHPWIMGNVMSASISYAYVRGVATFFRSFYSPILFYLFHTHKRLSLSVWKYHSPFFIYWILWRTYNCDRVKAFPLWLCPFTFIEIKMEPRIACYTISLFKLNSTFEIVRMKNITELKHTQKSNVKPTFKLNYIIYSAELLHHKLNIFTTIHISSLEREKKGKEKEEKQQSKCKKCELEEWKRQRERELCNNGNGE